MKCVLSDSDFLENIKKVNSRIERFERLGPRRSRNAASGVTIYERLRDHAFLPVQPLGGSIDITHKSISTIPSATKQYTTRNPEGHLGHRPAPYSEVIKHLPRLPISFYCLRSEFYFSHSGNVMSLGE
jgi:hypothetical protein